MKDLNNQDQVTATAFDRSVTQSTKASPSPADRVARELDKEKDSALADSVPLIDSLSAGVASTIVGSLLMRGKNKQMFLGTDITSHTPVTKEDNINWMINYPYLQELQLNDAEFEMLQDVESMEERDALLSSFGRNKKLQETASANPVTGLVGAVIGDLPFDVVGGGLIAKSAKLAGATSKTAQVALGTSVGAGASIAADVASNRAVDPVNAVAYALGTGVGAALIPTTPRATPSAAAAAANAATPSPTPAASALGAADNVADNAADNVADSAPVATPTTDVAVVPTTGITTTQGTSQLVSPTGSQVALREGLVPYPELRTITPDQVPMLPAPATVALLPAPKPEVPDFAKLAMTDSKEVAYVKELYAKGLATKADEASIADEVVGGSASSDVVAVPPPPPRGKGRPTKAQLKAEADYEAYVSSMPAYKYEANLDPFKGVTSAELKIAIEDLRELALPNAGTAGELDGLIKKQSVQNTIDLALNDGLWKTTPQEIAEAVIRQGRDKSFTFSSAETVNAVPKAKKPRAPRKAKVTDEALDTTTATTAKKPKLVDDASKHSLESLSAKAVESVTDGVRQLTKVEAETLVTKALGKSTGSLIKKGAINFVDSVDDLIKATGKAHPSDTMGFFDELANKSYVVLDNVPDHQVAGVVLHEVGVHQGMGGILGKKAWDAIKADAMAIPEVAAMAAKFKGVVPNGLEVEEAIAYFIQTEATATKGLIATIIDKIKLWARDILGGNIVALDESMLRQLAFDAIKKLDRSIAGIADETDDAIIKAYNDSGAPLDKYAKRSILSWIGSNNKAKTLTVADPLADDTDFRQLLLDGIDNDRAKEVIYRSINHNFEKSVNPVARFIGDSLYHNPDKAARLGKTITTTLEQEVIVLQKKYVGRLDVAKLKGLKAFTTEKLSTVDGINKDLVNSYIHKRAFNQEFQLGIKDLKVALKTAEDKVMQGMSASLDNLDQLLTAKAITPEAYADRVKQLEAQADAKVASEFAKVKQLFPSSVVKTNEEISALIDEQLADVVKLAGEVTDAVRQTKVIRDEAGEVVRVDEIVPTSATSNLHRISEIQNSEAYFPLTPNFQKFNTAIRQHGLPAVTEAMFKSLEEYYFTWRGIKPSTDDLNTTREIANLLVYMGSSASGVADNVLEITALGRSDITKKLLQVQRENPQSIVADYSREQIDNMAKLLSDLSTESKTVNFGKRRTGRNLDHTIDGTDLKLADLYEDNVLDSLEGYTKRVAYEMGLGNMTLKNTYVGNTAIGEVMRKTKLGFNPKQAAAGHVKHLAAAEEDAIPYLVPLRNKTTGAEMIRIDFTHNDTWDDLADAMVTSRVKDPSIEQHKYLQETMADTLRLFQGGAFDSTQPGDVAKSIGVLMNHTKASTFVLAAWSMGSEFGRLASRRFATAGFKAIPELKRAFSDVRKGMKDERSIREMMDVAGAYDLSYDIPSIFRPEDTLAGKANKVSKDMSNKMLKWVGYNGMSRFIKAASYRTSMGELRDIGSGLITGKQRTDLIKQWMDEGMGNSPADVERIADKVNRAWNADLNEIDMQMFNKLGEEEATVSDFQVVGQIGKVDPRDVKGYRELNDASTLAGSMQQRIKRNSTEAGVGQMPKFMQSRWFNVFAQFNGTALAALPAHVQWALNHRDSMLRHEIVGSFIGATLGYLGKTALIGIGDKETMDERLDPNVAFRNIMAMTTFGSIFPKVIDSGLSLFGQSSLFSYASASGRDYGTSYLPAWLTNTAKEVKGVTTMFGINPNGGTKDAMGALNIFSGGLRYAPGVKSFIAEHYPNVKAENKTDFVKQYLLPEDEEEPTK